MKSKYFMRLKVQKKLTAEEMVSGWEQMTSKERFDFLERIMEFGLFRIKADFLIETAYKNSSDKEGKYKANGNYEKYKDAVAFSNSTTMYASKHRGYLEGFFPNKREYKLLADSGQYFKKMGNVSFERV